MEAAERAELLKKLRSFSNFATSKLVPKELESKPDSGEAKPDTEPVITLYSRKVTLVLVEAKGVRIRSPLQKSN